MGRSGRVLTKKPWCSHCPWLLHTFSSSMLFCWGILLSKIMSTKIQRRKSIQYFDGKVCQRSRGAWSTASQRCFNFLPALKWSGLEKWLHQMIFEGPFQINPSPPLPFPPLLFPSPLSANDSTRSATRWRR